MKVNILLPITRPSGPHDWGANLADMLKQRQVTTRCIYELPKLLVSPFYQDADIVHTAVPLTYRLWKKPVIMTIHGEYTVERNLWRFFYPTAIRKADVVTIPSHFLKDRLRLEEAIVIPNAVIPERFRAVQHSEKDVLNLVTVTNFYFRDKAEGVLHILEAISTAQRAISSQIRYKVVGGGPFLERIKKLAISYNVNVEFTDRIPNVKEVLENSDIFLYNSLHDNFPMVILEAMACGLPVITNNVGAVSEIIDNGKDGYIIEDKLAYIDHLSNLLNERKLRATVGYGARETVRVKFNWATIVNDYIQIYEKLISWAPIAGDTNKGGRSQGAN